MIRTPTTIRRRRSGYTLVELMMTVAVLAIVAGMAIPSFEPDVAAQLDSFADVVAADFARIRQLAVANNSTYRITFEASRNRYYYEHSGTNSALNTLPPTIYRHADNTATKQYTDLATLPHLGPAVTLTTVQAMSTSPTNISTLEFGPLGATTQAADTVVWLTSGSNDNLRYVHVRVNAVTGLATPAEIDAVGPIGSSSPSGGSGS